jgi:Tol biopolymer transport system component
MKKSRIKNFRKNLSLLSLMTVLMVISVFCMQGEKGSFPALSGPYLGQSSPGIKSEIFAPGILSTGFNEHGLSFTPDGKELYFRILGAPRGAIYFMKEINGKWTTPEIVPFLKGYDAKCSLSPDGNKIVFSTAKPRSKNGKKLDHWEIWIAERSGDGWNEPVNINLKSDYDVACPSIANSGNIYYYSSSIKGGLGNGDIFMSKFENGIYSEPVNLGSPINTEYWENDPYISPDESYIIFQTDREGNHEYGDLVISYKDKNGSWIEPVNMGPNVNSPNAGVGCPWVTPDGKYLFYSSGITDYKRYSDEPLDYETKMRILNSPGYGSEDIFWVDAKIIGELKPDNLK